MKLSSYHQLTDGGHRDAALMAGALVVAPMAVSELVAIDLISEDFQDEQQLCR
jgi:hypothetical protein